MKSKTSLSVLVIGLSFILVVPTALAQQHVYPQRGQTSEQQKIDEQDCHALAVKQTNYNPTAVQTPQKRAATAPEKQVVKAPQKPATPTPQKPSATAPQQQAVKSPQKPAAPTPQKPAATAPQQHSQVQQQASVQKSTPQQNYFRAKAACLEGKGYTVK